MSWSRIITALVGSLFVLIPFESETSRLVYGFQSRVGSASSGEVNSFRVSDQPKTIATRLTRFNVPFRIHQPDESFVEVQLYLSRDEGGSWQFYGSQKTDSQSFPFVADGDGAYWFAVKTLDRNRQLLPDGNITQPELKVHVDTEIPKLEARVESDAAGRVICYWKAEDDYLLPGSVRILYQENVEGVAATQNWHKVPVSLTPQVSGKIYSDQLGWWPKTSIPYLNVRIEIADTAGNIARADRSIVVKQVAALRNSQSTAIRLPQAEQVDPSQPISPQVARKVARKRAGAAVLGSGEPLVGDRPGLVCQDGVCRPAVDAGADQEAYLKSVESSTSKLENGGFQLVGSPAEFSAPPIPDQYTSGNVETSPESMEIAGRPANQNVPRKVADDSEPSIPWPSESQAVVTKPNESDASTTQWNSHPSVPSGSQALIDYTPPRRQSTLVEPTQTPGESFVRQRGDMIVSQSTTMGRGKQFGFEKSSIASDISQNQLSMSKPPVTPAASRLTDSTNQPYMGTVNRVSSSPNYLGKDQQKVSVTESDTFRQAISNTRFQLQYGVRSVDPASVSRVVLWMTRDGGKSWRSWATDADRVSPMPVQVQDSGTYGFRIVVHSNDGLTGRAPASGDRPDIVVDVDTAQPNVQLVSAPYGRGSAAGKMVINWRVQDEHLIARPIRLLYSTSPLGPWTVIEEGLPDTGSYVWAVDKRTPSQVYLRVEARDRAGNMGFHQLQSPIDLSGLVPRGKIFGVQRMGSGQ